LPPHIKQRKDRGSTWYLIDCSFIKSLGTTKKGVALFLLDQYGKNKVGMLPCPRVKEFYDRWIATKVESLVRRSLIRDSWIYQIDTMAETPADCPNCRTPRFGMPTMMV
jgi:hypothetical protein